MMNINPSPAPWISRQNLGHSKVAVFDSENELVCMVGNGFVDGANAARVNAKKIAAIPDMIAALELVATSSMRNAAYDAAVAALIKTRGGVI